MHGEPQRKLAFNLQLLGKASRGLVGGVFFLGILLVAGFTVPVHGDEQQSIRLGMTLSANNAKLTSMKDLVADLDWIASPSALFVTNRPDIVTGKVTAKRIGTDAFALTLSLHNPTGQPITLDATFPYLHIKNPVADTPLSYCFPQEGLRLGSGDTMLRQAYSCRFPLQFLSLHAGDRGGVYVMSCDQDLHRKDYALQVNKNEGKLQVIYKGVTIPPGESITLPEARLGVFDGGWRGGFDAYRDWLKTWHKPVVPRKQWFREVFNFRQVFLYPNLDTPGLLNKQDGSLAVDASIKADEQRFGGVDYVHVFDWSKSPTFGRVGHYTPWSHLSRDGFNAELEKLHERGIPTGLYLEGYLVSPESQVPGRPHDGWQMKDPSGNAYDRFGGGEHTLCPAIPEWRSFLSNTLMQTANDTRAKGYYLDQLGFGWQYACHDPTHGHAVPSNQVKHENTLLKQAREQLPDDRLLYIEQSPVDVTTQYLDGSFSYSLLHSRNNNCPSRTTLFRFAFPEHKTIQILKGDAPIGDDIKGVMLSLFNGDGLWLVGPSDSTKWYSERVLDAVRRSHRIKRDYRDAFTSTDVTPLVKTLQDGVYAHRFAGKDATVYTLYNANDQAIQGPVIRVPHAEGSTYLEAWDNKPVTVHREADHAIVEITIPAGSVRCLVQATTP